MVRVITRHWRSIQIAAIVCLWSTLLLAGSNETANKLPFTADELARLERDEVVIKHTETKVSDTEQSSKLVASVLIHHPPEVIWEVLDHPEREKEWIPHLKKSAVVSDKRPTPTTRVNVTDYKFTLLGLKVYYSLVREYDYKAKTIKAYLDKERPYKFFRDIEAGWNFYPWRDGIIFQYWSDSKLTINLPKVISKRLAEKQLASGVMAIRKRCDYIATEMKHR